MFEYSISVCPYLKDRINRIKLKRPNGRNFTVGELQEHLEKGWSLFSEWMQIPKCMNCTECKPYRVLANDFKPSRSFRKVLRNNKETRVELFDLHYSDEAFEIYTRYITWRAKTRDWRDDNKTLKNYVDWYTIGPKHLKQLHFYQGDNLVAVSYLLFAKSSTYAMQCYYDPDFSDLSLGTFSILKQIEMTKKLGFNHYYMGFYVQGCQSIKYKDRFFPSEFLEEGRWQRFK